MRAVLQGGKSVGSRMVALYWRENGGAEVRVALVAGRALGKAVRRNRARRLLREAVRRHLTEIRPGVDLVCIARVPAVRASLADVEGALLRLLERAGLLMRGPAADASPGGGEGRCTGPPAS